MFWNNWIFYVFLSGRKSSYPPLLEFLPTDLTYRKYIFLCFGGKSNFFLETGFSIIFSEPSVSNSQLHIKSEAKKKCFNSLYYWISSVTLIRKGYTFPDIYWGNLSIWNIIYSQDIWKRNSLQANKINITRFKIYLIFIHNSYNSIIISYLTQSIIMLYNTD